MKNHLTPDLLVDFLHGELSPAEDALAHAHMAACAACQAEYDIEASVTGALRAAAKAEEREMPSLVNAAVWQQIREARPGPFARMAAWMRPAVAVPLAAVLIVGGWFASPYSHASPHPTIDAAYYFQTHAAQASQSTLSERPNPQTLETSMTGDAGGGSPVVERAAAGYAASGTLDAVQ